MIVTCSDNILIVYVINYVNWGSSGQLTKTLVDMYYNVTAIDVVDRVNLILLSCL